MTTENHLNEFVQINPETRKDLQNTTEELLKVEHLDLDNRQYLASVLFCLGRYEESIEEFERILSMKEKDEKIIADIAICHFKIGNYRSALEYLKRGLEITPESESMLTYEMLCFEFLEDLENAIKTAKKIIKVNEKNEQVIRRIIDYHFRLENYWQCLDYIDSIEYDDHFKKALVLYRLKRYEECIELSRKVKTAESYRLTGRAYRKLGNIAKAAKYLFRSFQKDFNVDTLFEISEIYFEVKDSKKAVYYLKNVLLHDEDNVMACCKIADAYLNSGNWIEAIEYAERALKISKKATKAYITLAEAHLQLNRCDCEKSMEIIENAIAENPDSADLWVEKGDLLFCHDLVESGRAYQKAIELEPTDCSIYVRYIDLLILAGEEEMAKIPYNQLLLINPLYEKSFQELCEPWP